MIRGNPNIDFKEQHPGFCTILEFSDLYDENPKYASKILWATYYMIALNDSNNPYRNTSSRKLRIESIKENYYPEYDNEKYKYLESVFKNIIMSKEELLLIIQITKLEQITSYFDTLDLSANKDSIDDFLKITKALPSVWKEFKRLKEELMDSNKIKTTTHGNTELSARDKRNV